MDDVTKPAAARPPLARGEAALGVAAFLAWCVLFHMGNTVGSAPFFQRLNASTALLAERVAAFFMILLVYTPLNVFLLSCTAGYVGCFFSRVEASPPGDAARPTAIWKRYVLAVFGAFMVYLIILSGLLAVAGIPFQLPRIDDKEAVEDAQMHYRVTAAFGSFFGMVEGARPFVMEAVAGRIQALLTPRPRDGGAGSPPPGGTAGGRNP